MKTLTTRAQVWKILYREGFCHYRLQNIQPLSARSRQSSAASTTALSAWHPFNLQGSVYLGQHPEHNSYCCAHGKPCECQHRF